jgi:thiamine-monophosphate kinase
VIDVSDGLVADLGHVLAASRVGADLDSARVPVPRGFAAACARAGVDPRRLALTGGEDYELLFTARGRRADAAALSRALGVRVTAIGTIRAGRGLHGVATEGAGYAHF